MSDITNPHDAFFKHFMTKPEIATDFLTQHLPADVLALLDLSTLTEQKESFIDAELHQHFSDVLYQVKTRRGKPLYIYQLFEHKSYLDKWVAFQLLRYKVRIWEKESAKHGRISPIVSLVIYHGEVRWTSPKSFAALFDWDEDDQEIERVLQFYLPDFSYHLVDLSILSDEEIRGGVWLQVFERLLKHIFDPALGSRLPEILALVAEVASQPTGFDMLVTLLRYIARSGVGVSSEEIRHAVLTLFPKEGAVLMKTAAQEWIEEARQEGEVIGLQKAHRQTILQILQHRFAPSAEIANELREQLNQIEESATLDLLVNYALQTMFFSDFVQRVAHLLATPAAET